MKRHFDGPAYALLIVGGFIIVWVVSLTLQNLTDETIYHVLLPGIVVALPLFVWAWLRLQKPSHNQRPRGALRVSKTHRL